MSQKIVEAVASFFYSNTTMPIVEESELGGKINKAMLKVYAHLSKLRQLGFNLTVRET